MQARLVIPRSAEVSKDEDGERSEANSRTEGHMANSNADTARQFTPFVYQ
jgi:hypothetical protein